jgi:hypothetical protein
MDLESIALHELGHWLRLLDLYGADDANKIMYGFASYGVMKRTLTSGDLSGIQWIYPSVLNIIYVKKDGACGAGKTPCYSSIQNGINAADSVTIIEMTQETFAEDIILSSPKVLTFRGGWDSTFTAIQSNTTINHSLMISDGTLIVENILLQ